MSATALADEASLEDAPVERARPEFRAGAVAALATAVVVGVPSTVELGRVVTTVVLSLILGH